jgi:hypothetical protein
MGFNTSRPLLCENVASALRALCPPYIAAVNTPATKPPAKGDTLTALRRLPLVGADLNRDRSRKVGRKVDIWRVAVLAEDQELSPNDAGDVMGISRPLVVHRMNIGDLPFRYVSASTAAAS